MKNAILTLVFSLLSITLFAQKQTYQLSSHILDISKGLPAAGVTIQL
jgi:5-hydroxyisourate hydrolase